MSLLSNRNAFVLLTTVCALTLFAALGRAALWEPDEARFAEATRQMLDRGDLLTPHFNGLPRFEKPILFYWLQLPFFAVLGPGEWTARLPSALAAAGSVALTFLIGRRLFGTTAAWLATLALATSFRFVAYSRQGLTDVPALFFELLAIHAFLRADQGARRAWIAAWAAVGLCALTKGPVAVIPVLVWAAFYAGHREWAGLRRMHLAAGPLVAAGIVAPWLLYMLAVHGRAFVDVAFVSEVVARVQGAVGPPRGLFYYFDVWPADLLPWTPFFLAALGWLFVARNRLDPSVRRAALFTLVWFVTVLALFTVSRAKLPHYLLPSHPAAALLTGLFVERVARREAPRPLWWAGAMLVVTLLLASTVLLGALLRRTSSFDTVVPPLILPLLLAAGAAAIVVAGRRRGPVAGSLAIAVTTAAATAYAALIVPTLDGLQPIPHLGKRIAATAGPGARVGQYGSVVSAGLVYYSRHRVELLTSPDAAVRFLQGPGEAFLVLPRPDVQSITARAPDDAHELASSPRLVVRFDRLFGDRSPYEEGLVVVANRP